MPIHENSQSCSVDFDFDAVEEDQAGLPPLAFSDVLEALRRHNRFIRQRDRARLTVDCMFLALGDEDSVAETMTTIATKYGITKAAVSKRTKEIREHLHLSINGNNKSEAATRQYRNNQSPLRIARTA